MRFHLLNLPRVCPNLQTRLLTGALLVSVGLTGCGAGLGNTGASAPVGTTTVTVLSTSTANDQVSQFGMVLNSLTLTSQSGSTVSLISAPIDTEFLHVNGVSEPLLSVTVPQGTYTAATASVGTSAFTCLGIAPSDGYPGNYTFAYGYTPAANVTVSLPSPIAIAGNNASLHLNLQVPQSASYDKENCMATPIGGSNWSITPTFTLTLASEANPMQIGLKGSIGATVATGGSFTVTAADGPIQAVNGPIWQVATDADTVYQGIGGFSELEARVPIDMDAALQPDGSLLARRIAVYDTNPSELSMPIGQVMIVFGGGTALYSFPVEQLGALNLNFFAFNLSDAIFQTSGQLSNVQRLPFPASFTPANVVAGQNVYATSHSLLVSPPPIYVPAATITLVPQTINGTVSSIGSEGGFTIYTVTLAPYDLFPALAVQPGQTTLLTDPNTVVVYADSNTRTLNTTTLAVGDVGRFYGLVFNDNGTLRMDCAQINDGVAE